MSPRRDVNSAAMQRRAISRKPNWVLAAVLVSSLTLAGCGSYTKQSIDYHFGLHGAPTQPQQAASSYATRTYRSLIVQSSQRFAGAVGNLRDAAQRGDLREAQRQWAIAQASYDMVRGEITAHSTTELMIAGRLQDQPFFIGRTGLHAVEQDLFSSDHGSLNADAETLAGQGTLLEIGLLRTVRTPSRIMTTATQSLGWAINDVIANPQQPFAQSDLLDVSAVIALTHQALAAVTPLALDVAPRHLDTARQRLAALEETLGHATTVRLSGDINVTPNSAVSPATWRLLAVQMTALLSPLTQLGGDMDGFGTGRTYA